MNDPGSRSDTMCVPGAERSGLRVPSPSLVKARGPVVRTFMVFSVLAAPTAIT